MRVPVHIATIVVALAVSALPPPALAATPGGGFGLKPAHYDPNDRVTLSYFKRSQAPGGSFSDQVVVTNTGDEGKQLLVNPVDGLTGQTTGSVYANRQDPVREAGTWIATDAQEVSVAPHSTTSLGFTVRVPANAPPGDHLAGIAFQDKQTASTGGQVGITQVARRVIGVLTQVSGPAQPFSLGIDRFALQPLTLSSSQSAIVVELGDRGQLLGKPLLTLTLDGPNRYHRSLSRQLDTLLPGDTIRYPFAWPDVLGLGSYRTCATGGLPGGPQARRCQTLQVKAQATPQVQTSSTPGPALSPWLWLLVPLIAAGLVAAYLLGRHRGGGGRGNPPPWRPWSP